MNAEQKEIVSQEMKVIQTFLDEIQQRSFIGSWEFGVKSNELGIWDPKKKKTFKEYLQAINIFKTKSKLPGFQPGFTLICKVQNPQNTHQITICEKQYIAPGIFIHYLDFVNYDQFRMDLDIIAHALEHMDLREFPAKPIQQLKVVN